MKIHKVEFKFEYSLRFKQKENGMKKKEKDKNLTWAGLPGFGPPGEPPARPRHSPFHRALTAGPPRSAIARDSRSRSLPRFCLWRVGPGRQALRPPP